MAKLSFVLLLLLQLSTAMAGPFSMESWGSIRRRLQSGSTSTTDSKSSGSTGSSSSSSASSSGSTSSAKPLSSSSSATTGSSTSSSPKPASTSSSTSTSSGPKPAPTSSASTASSNSTASTTPSNSTSTAKPASNSTKTASNTTKSTTTKKEETDESIMDDDEYLQNSTGISQLDMANSSWLSNSNSTNATSHLLPPEQPEPDSWPVTVMVVFVAVAAVLCLMTGVRLYRKRKRSQYEDINSHEIQSLVV